MQVGITLFLISLYTLLRCVKFIVQSCGYVGLSGFALQNSISKCLMLIPHRQLENFKLSFVGYFIHKLL